MAVFYPEGSYHVEVVKNGIGENQKGNPLVFIQFKVIATMDGEPVEHKTRAYEKVISDKTIPYLAKDITNMGIKGPDGKPLSSFVRLDPSVKGGVSLAGTKLVMQCKYKEGMRGSDLWEEWGPPYNGGKSYESSSTDKLKELHNKYGAAFAAAVADPDQF